jgi:hypothetical protein
VRGVNFGGETAANVSSVRSYDLINIWTDYPVNRYDLIKRWIDHPVNSYDLINIWTDYPVNSHRSYRQVTTLSKLYLVKKSQAKKRLSSIRACAASVQCHQAGHQEKLQFGSWSLTSQPKGLSRLNPKVSPVSTRRLFGWKAQNNKIRQKMMACVYALTTQTRSRLEWGCEEYSRETGLSSMSAMAKRHPRKTKAIREIAATVAWIKWGIDQQSVEKQARRGGASLRQVARHTSNFAAARTSRWVSMHHQQSLSGLLKQWTPLSLDAPSAEPQWTLKAVDTTEH